MTVEFKWAPYLQNLTLTLDSFSQMSQPPTLIMASAGIWDLPHVTLGSAEATVTSVDGIASSIARLSPVSVDDGAGSEIGEGPIFTWMQPLPIVDSQLHSHEKKEYMNEDSVAQYRAIVSASRLPATVSVLLNPKQVCDQVQQRKSTDGVHYSPAVYSVLSQILTNGWKSFLVDSEGSAVARSSPIPSDVTAYVPKPTGSMRNPILGSVVVASILVMLLTMDNFFGIGLASLVSTSCGRVSLSWQEAYEPILRKMGISTQASQTLEDNPILAPLP